MDELFDILKLLCNESGISGDEKSVREKIIAIIKDFCMVKTDALGNIIAFKKGKKTPVKKVMCDAHLDEVGFIITDITDDGFLKFAPVGGIDVSVMLARRVTVGKNIKGTVGIKPVHLSDKEELKSVPKQSALYIDIGADSKEDALKYVSIGDSAVMDSEFEDNGRFIKSKALDDRIGCAVLAFMLRQEAEYDYYVSFSVQEEVGLRGAKASAYSIDPDSAIVIDGTTASDIAGTPETSEVCNLGRGAVVSFMDRATLYDKELYNFAMKSNIKCQPKRAVAGGNNAGSIHLSKNGVRTIAISNPCRYIHSAASVADKSDIISVYELVKYILDSAAAGKV